MKYELKEITLRELVENYIDNEDEGVYAFNNRLEVRPPYQREFVYKDKQRDDVIKTVFEKAPLQNMYWFIKEDGFELMDGQQRTISVCQYITNNFSINHKYFHNLTKDEQEEILNYKLMIYICDGTEKEKLDWFRRINTQGEKMTEQELLNAVYVGEWLSDAKRYFSKRNCPAYILADNYVKGSPIRQELLEKALSWIADRDNLSCGEDYMALHQHDKDANDLWVYFKSVIDWAKTYFSNYYKGITDNQEWGILYNKYHNNKYNTNELDNEIKNLILDDDITKSKGIIEYLLSNKKNEKALSIRAFSAKERLIAYTKQNGICPICGKHFELNEMHADHITPWSKGGRTIDDNCQMLCADCNRRKSDI